MIWIVFGFTIVILGFILLIIYLLNKIEQLQMYKNEVEVKQILLKINSKEDSSNA
jgi:flagellar biogenesis protein FliO